MLLANQNGINILNENEIEIQISINNLITFPLQNTLIII